MLQDKIVMISVEIFCEQSQLCLSDLTFLKLTWHSLLRLMSCEFIENVL